MRRGKIGAIILVKKIVMLSRTAIGMEKFVVLMPVIGAIGYRMREDATE